MNGEMLSVFSPGDRTASLPEGLSFAIDSRNGFEEPNIIICRAWRVIVGPAPERVFMAEKPRPESSNHILAGLPEMNIFEFVCLIDYN